MRGTKTLLLAILLAALPPAAGPHAQQVAAPTQQTDIQLKPTAHPRLPADISQLWFAPAAAGRRASGDAPTAAQKDLAAAVTLEVNGDFAKALPILSKPSTQQGLL